MITKVIANWKCNMKLENIYSYFDKINNYNFNNIEIGIAIPSILLDKSMQLIKNHQVNIYAQDFESHQYGSFTGRISYEHLLDLGIKHTIIGHSEQRRFDDNTDFIINQKVLKALDNGFNIVLCIGEPLKVYESNEAMNYLEKQLSIALANVQERHLSQITIAYEPIWSIGTGLLLGMAELNILMQQIRDYIHDLLKDKNFNIKYLYGGSVNLDNIEKLCSLKNIDGFLIGSASLNDRVFLAMLDIVQLWKK